MLSFSAFAERPLLASSIESSFELDANAYFPQRSFEIRNWKGTQVSVLESSEIESVFLTLASSNLPFRYAKDCCHDRAHKMSYWMDQRGIHSLKVFVFGDLRLKTKTGPDVIWEFHVAPALMNTDGEIIVLDPSVSNQPLELKSWMRRFSKPGQKIKIRAANRFIYSPGDLDSNRTEWDLTEMAELVDLSLMGCKAIETRNQLRSANQ